MNYEDYVEKQVKDQKVKKPLKYRVGQRRAIDWFFKEHLPEISYGQPISVLDVGCGDGTGVRYLSKLGFDAHGIDLHPKKVELSVRAGYDVVCGDVMTYCSLGRFDIIWSSHSFEHMLEPHKALKRFKDLAKVAFFVLPYPDKGDNEIVHCASSEIGLRIDDGGETLKSWFRSHGASIIHSKLDSYREPEIWLQAIL